MPLQNRVDPSGELFAHPARGTLMGNRGGRFHTAARTLTARRWASRQWICCVLAFKQRRRDVWGRFYTELFFLDEPTALAAGHRPCFECRREDAASFAEYWRIAHGLRSRLRATAMDRVLHRERLQGRAKRRHRQAIDSLPDAAFVAIKDEAFAVRGDALLRWTPTGYDARRARPRGVTVDVLTPPAIVAVLAAGFMPRWHPTAAGF
ncbi:MAG: hypothetical protein ACTHJS_05975 [Xanthobacteraceae bacterium]